jgi:hypothetical protein
VLLASSPGALPSVSLDGERGRVATYLDANPLPALEVVLKTAPGGSGIASTSSGLLVGDPECGVHALSVCQGRAVTTIEHERRGPWTSLVLVVGTVLERRRHRQKSNICLEILCNVLLTSRYILPV